MLKLLIVDDEYNIREGLANAVDWASAGIAEVKAAGSAAEALGLLGGFRPDIVITDIFMEAMNGLELIEAISENHQDVKFILISGYDEFSYARKAIDLKVFRYLLKPILPEEILSVVQSLAEEIREEQDIRAKIGMFEREIGRNRDTLVRQLLHDILYGRAGIGEELGRRMALLDMEAADLPHVCIAFEMDSAPGGEMPYPSSGMLPLGIQSIAEEVFKRFPSRWAYAGDDDRVYVIAGGTREIGPDEACLYCIERLQKIVKQNLGVTVSAGIGGCCEGLSAVSRSRREALQALEYRVSAGPESIVHIRDALALDGARAAYPSDEERRILEAVSREDRAGLRPAVDAFFSTLPAENLQDRRIRSALYRLYGALSSEPDAPPAGEEELAALSGIDTLEDARLWILEAAGQALERLAGRRGEGIRSVIHSAEKYIQANYKDMELSLTMVAEQMGLTSCYFSRLFKQETGSSYIDYVINLRIEHAKRLLRTTTNRIFNIGEMVGYPNSQYFCTLFKKACGVSPAEYREGKDGA
jgi:two-component system response regulator YesN